MLKWDDKLNLGVASIDDEHKYLLFLANEVVSAVKGGGEGKTLIPLFRKLHEYTVTHFHNEEEYMAGISFPGLAEHQRQHHDLKHRVLEYQDHLYRKRDVSADEVIDFMKGWLVDHIIHSDFGIARFLKEKEAADRAGDALESAAEE